MSEENKALTRRLDLPVGLKEPEQLQKALKAGLRG